VEPLAKEFMERLEVEAEKLLKKGLSPEDILLRLKSRFRVSE
jgi:hypothetical protein